MQTCQVTYLGGDYYIKNCSGEPLLDEVSDCVGGGVGEDVEDESMLERWRWDMCEQAP